MNEEQRVAFSRSILKIADGVLGGELEAGAVIERFKAGITWLKRVEKPTATGSSPPESERLGPTPAEVRDIFDHWQKATNRPTAVLDTKRKGIIRRGLANFSAVKIKHLVAWCAQDSFYSGANDRNKRYDWLETMLRSNSRIEELLERSAWGNTVSLGDDDGLEQARKRKHLERESLQALKEHRTDDYNRLEEELKKL